MKISKQQWMLIAGVGILAVVYWFFFRKKKAESGYDKNVMIFGNESGYDAYEVGPGSESGYLKKCPKGQTLCENDCTMIVDPDSNGGLTKYKYKCCCPDAETGRGMSVAPKYTKRPAGSARKRTCFDSKGKEIPCPVIKEEDITSTSTFGG